MGSFSVNWLILSVEVKLSLGKQMPAMVREKLGVGSVFEHNATKVEERTKLLQAAINKFSTKELTQIINDKDVMRDFATSGFHMALESCARFKKDPKSVATAESLLSHLFLNGIAFIRGGKVAQDGLTKDLLEKMDTDTVKAQIEELKLGHWREWIRETQEEMDQARKDRTSQVIGANQVVLRDAEKSFDSAIRLLVDSLMDELDDPVSPMDKKAIEEILDPLKSAMSSARAVETRGSAQASQAQGEGAPTTTVSNPDW